MATAARRVEAVAAATRRVEAARLSATAARGVEAAAAATPGPSLSDLAEGERVDELVISLMNLDSLDWMRNGWELDWEREATAGNGGGYHFF
uniref:Uncharacterized protein n=1 Tax=Oryza meridionalis TaxID=40149 RepID=A0A0E0CP37_9ORYZ